MPKIRKSFLLLSFFSITACQSTSGVFKGLNAHYPNPLAQKTMAEDTGRELNFLFLPAKDKIQITQDADKDIFGKTLISDLRNRGFSVEEITEKNAKIPASQEKSLSINYLVDGMGNNDWRVTLFTPEGVKYNRQYQTSNNTKLAPTPLGSWIKEEVDHDR